MNYCLITFFLFCMKKKTKKTMVLCTQKKIQISRKIIKLMLNYLFEFCMTKIAEKNGTFVQKKNLVHKLFLPGFFLKIYFFPKFSIFFGI